MFLHRIYVCTCSGMLSYPILYSIFAIQVTWAIITNLMLAYTRTCTHTYAQRQKYEHNKPSLEQIRRNSKLVAVHCRGGFVVGGTIRTNESLPYYEQHRFPKLFVLPAIRIYFLSRHISIRFARKSLGEATCLEPPLNCEKTLNPVTRKLHHHSNERLEESDWIRSPTFAQNSRKVSTRVGDTNVGKN